MSSYDVRFLTYKIAVYYLRTYKTVVYNSYNMNSYDVRFLTYKTVVYYFLTCKTSIEKTEITYITDRTNVYPPIIH